MNNRVQQRFDRSIHEAVEATARAKVERDAAAQVKREALARRMLPAIERALRSGLLGGNPFSDDERRELLNWRSRYRNVLGLTLDRKGEEL